MVANTIDIVNAVANFDVDARFIEGFCHQHLASGGSGFTQAGQTGGNTFGVT